MPPGDPRPEGAADCLAAPELERYLTGEEDAAARRRVDRHVAACPRCGAALDEVSANLDEGARVRRAVAGEPAELRPDRVGGYRVLGVLGHGGMGVVYLAEQERPKRHVALKLMRLDEGDPAARDRFEREAEVLGRLQHPGIAQVLEAGLAEVQAGGTSIGVRPFLVMELVRGERLDGFVESRPMDVRERLEILAHVADAVQHAHGRGVLHRDLKPQNVVVVPAGDAGGLLPKVLDFGVARLMDTDARTAAAATRQGQLLGTVPYMSPEQVSGAAADLDARSDVYALGVLGFFMLTGRLPHDLEGRSLASAIRTVQDATPRRAGAVDPKLRGDVDRILAKCLERDRERRYASASELAADIRRHLSGEPVTARAPTLAYQLSRLVRRHAVASAMAGLLLLSLLASALGMAAALGRATRAETAAREEAAATRRLADFLVGLFTVSDPAESRGESVTARELLDRGHERLLHDAQLGEEARVPLLGTVADVYAELGLPEQSVEARRRSLAAARAAWGEGDARTLAERSALGRALLAVGRLEEAESHVREALSGRRQVLGADHLDVAESLDDLGTLCYQRRDGRAAERAFRRSLELRVRHLGGRHADVAESWNNLAQSLLVLDRVEEAGRAMRRALAILEHLHGPDHPRVLAGRANLATIAYRTGDLEIADAFLSDVVEARRRILGPEHPSLATGLNNLAQVRLRSGDLEGAEVLFRESLHVLRASGLGGHRNTAATLTNLATVLQRLGRDAEAVPLLAEALPIYESATGEADAVTVPKVRGRLGESLVAVGRLGEAERELTASHAALAAALGPDHPETRRAVARLERLDAAGPARR